MENKVENATCPVTMTANLIGGRWKLIILYHLSGHTRRFGEIAARIPSISRKVLSQQLKELEEDGLIIRQQFKEIPPRVEYSLSELGESLKPVLHHMESWGIETMLNARSKKV
ncbi:winged helix-turn-helix transcriptional regulator [Mucilaginibacter aquaedulcis]|jgi:DNA-binding HxlR family transcriptional regulator|uniref:winged helix-turn-helix transcriptional regulator n=1 Tax=Mucilaginibacter aquaedulcis TaxID=1187081 RepID=UPI0025B5177C|nr:helix-turn-helix domain-containing protein [Mucilaginibacter aquaedulcis]MDN3550012.1 helix-turn-helix domain-containing protein [Mucilaginibacter aquaedulcis]